MFEKSKRTLSYMATLGVILLGGMSINSSCDAQRNPFQRPQGNTPGTQECVCGENGEPPILNRYMGQNEESCAAKVNEDPSWKDRGVKCWLNRN